MSGAQLCLGATYKRSQDLCIAFLDLSNAFGEFPHSAVFDAIAKSGLGDDFLVFIQEVYVDNTTCIML